MQSGTLHHKNIVCLPHQEAMGFSRVLNESDRDPIHKDKKAHIYHNYQPDVQV